MKITTYWKIENLNTNLITKRLKLTYKWLVYAKHGKTADKRAKLNKK